MIRLPPDLTAYPDLTTHQRKTMTYATLITFNLMLMLSSTVFAGKPELNKRGYPAVDVQSIIIEAELNSITGSALKKPITETGCKDVNIGNTGNSDPFKSGGFGDTNIAVTNVTVFNICR